LALAGLIIAMPIAARPAKAPTTLTERNRAIVTDFANIFYTQRDPRAAMMKHVVPDYIQHNPRAADGRDAAIALLVPLFGAPGATFEVKRIIVDGDLAVIHVHGRPDPKAAGVAAIDIYRLKNGKIVEHWDAVQPITPSGVNPHPFF
jgi:predicted SnoaL-like aldol condensation-catalyzing enzyme